MKYVALVTGAANGIGFAVAQHLASTGAHVLVTDLSLSAAENAAQKIIAKGFSAEAYQLNVTEHDHIQGIVNKTERIDIVVNNAGIQHVSRLEEFPIEKWKLVTDILLVAPAMITKAVLPKMRQHQFGRIINIGSIHSLVASPYKSAYVAAKHGLIGFSKVVALETADVDITINTICPSYVKTTLVEQQITSQAEQHGISEDEVIQQIMLKPMPKKAFIDTQEIAETVSYLTSSAARNITGQSIVLDGGWTAT